MRRHGVVRDMKGAGLFAFRLSGLVSYFNFSAYLISLREVEIPGMARWYIGHCKRNILVDLVCFDMIESSAQLESVEYFPCLL